MESKDSRRETKTERKMPATVPERSGAAAHTPAILNKPEKAGAGLPHSKEQNARSGEAERAGLTSDAPSVLEDSISITFQ